MNYTLSGIDLPLEQFDNVEVQAIEEIDGFCTPIHPDSLGDNPEALYYWAVYLHYDASNPLNEGFGGVEWVADLPTKLDAERLADGLLQAVYSVRSVSL